MRSATLALSLLLVPLSSARAQAQVDVHVGLPAVSIGLVFPVYPELVQVPGQPVYYAPRADANYFFCDGLYWVFRGDRWYASAWYDGPWQLVAWEQVPSFVLRVPVRFYRDPPPYFRGWHGDDSPRWGERRGRDWERRSGWNRRDGHAAPRPAALPVTQRDYQGDRYPRAVERQRAIAAEHGHERSREDGSRHRGGSEDGRGRDGGHDRDDGHGRKGGHGRDEGHDRDGGRH